MGFICALLIFIADIWAILRCWSSMLSLTARLLWTLLIFLFPVGGLILFVLFGRAGRIPAH